jgi:hypothetical protein
MAPRPPHVVLQKAFTAPLLFKMDTRARDRDGHQWLSAQIPWHVPPVTVAPDPSCRMAAMQNQMSPIIRACAVVGLALLLTSNHAAAQTQADDIRARVKERQKQDHHHRLGRPYHYTRQSAARGSSIRPDRQD